MITIESGVLELVLRWAILGLEAAGICVIVLGAALAIYQFVRDLPGNGVERAYRSFRATLGRSLLMGLEFLVGADILKSLVMPHELENLLGLAVLMLARTFLSLSLSVEINGHWPWEESRLQREIAQGLRSTGQTKE